MKREKAIHRLALGLLVTTGISALAAWAFPAFEYAQADSIEKVEIQTRRKLAEYQRTKNAEPLLSWIMSQDAALYTAAMYTLGEWAMHHQPEFLTFLDAIEDRRWPEFTEGFCFVLADAGMDDDFRKAFRGYRSRRLSSVLDTVPDLMPWPKP